MHSGMSPPDALHKAYASIYQMVQAQAATLAYIDTFMVPAVISAIMFVPVPRGFLERRAYNAGRPPAQSELLQDALLRSCLSLGTNR